MVSQRGIEANPEKIQAILNMEPRATAVEVQWLTRRVAVLSRFMSKSAEKCQPFFRLLKNIQEFEWTPLAVSPTAVSAVLVQRKDKEERPGYYVSKILHGAAVRYRNIEKFAFAVVTAARKLRPYFQAHTIVL
ncbi:uncharacterized protein LOC143863320 [Tasmannia lanceolata]|uniref:uncharacterized protein LOC143863320 n=1 Tax=Tasmannia lanceolata TaxID=3420 RepID=UPI00406464FE